MSLPESSCDFLQRPIRGITRYELFCSRLLIMYWLLSRHWIMPVSCSCGIQQLCVKTHFKDRKTSSKWPAIFRMEVFPCPRVESTGYGQLDKMNFKEVFERKDGALGRTHKARTRSQGGDSGQVWGEAECGEGGCRGPVTSQPGACSYCRVLVPWCLCPWVLADKYPCEVPLSPSWFWKATVVIHGVLQGWQNHKCWDLGESFWKTGQNLVYKTPVDMNTSVIVTVYPRTPVLKYEINLSVSGIIWTIHLAMVP